MTSSYLVLKAWSPQARQAAIEARKRKSVAQTGIDKNLRKEQEDYTKQGHKKYKVGDQVTLPSGKKVKIKGFHRHSQTGEHLILHGKKNRAGLYTEWERTSAVHKSMTSSLSLVILSKAKYLSRKKVNGKWIYKEAH